MVTLTPQAFAEKWANTALSERASYQQHFLDLCAMLGAPALVEVDPTGEFFTFEVGYRLRVIPLPVRIWA